MIKVSIITVVYNNRDYIQSCIESVLSQDYYNVEYIVIDGASNDGTIDIINFYKDRISYFASEPDNGIYDALNKAIQISTGEIIGFLHSDDVFNSDNVITKVVDIFVRNCCGIVYSDLVYVSKNNSEKIIRYWKSGSCKNEKIKNGWMPPHPTVFLKTEVFIKCGLFDVSYKISADYDLIIRLLFKYQITTYYLSEVTVRMRIGGKSNKSIVNVIKKSKEDYRILKNNGVPLPLKALLLKNIRKIPQLFF